MRVDLDLKRLDAFGDRIHDAVDRATIGIMTASLVVGPSIVMTVSGRADRVRGVPAYLLRAGWLPDRIRQQPLGYPFDLALRTAMT